jgi:alkyl sulfatase BDS1-like metallo-beta-lactamase superfamily hydrolase
VAGLDFWSRHEQLFLYDRNVGYWQPDLQGLDHLGRADRAELLVDYLGISEKQLVKTVERLAADGKYELAASLLESSGSRFERRLPWLTPNGSCTSN